MALSIPGLLIAAFLGVAGLVQYFLLGRVFERARDGLDWQAAEQKRVMHDRILRVVLFADLLILPALGYYFGPLLFD